MRISDWSAYVCSSDLRDGGLVRLLQIPAPVMPLDQTGVVARRPVQHPVADRDMRIIIGAAKVAGALGIPCGPAFPFVGGKGVIGTGEFRREIGRAHV